MADMLTRQIQDNRLLRMGGQLDVSLGSSLGAIMDIPMMTGLLGQRADLAEAEFMGWTQEQHLEYARQDQQLSQEQDELTLQLRWLSDPVERDNIIARIKDIQAQRDSALDAATQQSIDEGRMQTPEALNEQYGDIGLTFDRPMAIAEAKLLAENKRAEIIRQSIVDAGPDGFIPGMARFGANLLNTATDPLELASMFVPVVSEARLAALTARFGRIGGRAIAGAIEAGVGAAATEPIYYSLSRSQQLDYDMSDALLNVGLGVVFGGAFGAGVGVFRRADIPMERIDPQTERIVPEINRQMADVALRQFVTDQPVNISRLIDGTDLRSTTTLSRVGGIEFQARQVAPLPTGMDTRPIVSLHDASGNLRVFDSEAKAAKVADRVGGNVAKTEDGFIVRHPVDADIVRDPTGKPLTFNTERQAEKFRQSARALPEDAKVMPININGERVFAVFRGATPEAIRAMERGAETLEIPDGVNTRETTVLPNKDALFDQAIKRTVADTFMAKKFAADAMDVTNDPAANVPASLRAEKVLPETFVSDNIDEMEAAIKYLETVNELSDEAKADIEFIRQMENHAKAYREAAEAAAACVVT